MNRRTKMKKILICLLTVCLVLGLVACGGGDKEFTGVELKNSSVVYDGTAKTIAVTGAPEGTDIAYVYKNSAGQTVEEVILPGEYDVTATLTKEGYKELVLTADLTVVPANFSGVAFENRTVTYTGEAIEFAATGVPAGAEAKYVIKNSAGETIDEIVNPGTYSVTVKVTKTGYTDKEITATITVEPAEIDGVTFNGMQVTYDGTAKTLTAGNIPQGASVVYAYKNAAGETVQEAVAAGVYTVTATVSMPNHNDKVLTATLTIVPSEITGPSIEDKTVDYNGIAHTIEAADVPADCTVVYVITDENGDVVDEAIDAGVYKVTATISKPNYKDLVLEATLTISKLDITGITFDDATFAYTGEAVTVSAQGIGEGFTAVYVYKNSAGETVQEAVAAGTYTVTLTVSKSNYNDFTKTITLTITEFDINDIVFQDVTVTYDG